MINIMIDDNLKRESVNSFDGLYYLIINCLQFSSSRFTIVIVYNTNLQMIFIDKYQLEREREKKTNNI